MSNTPTAPFVPVKNMRVTFWGTQGSCPFFPEPHEVAEYRRLISMDTLTRVAEDLWRRPDVANLLRSGAPSETLQTYLTSLGLTDPPVYGGDTTCISVQTAEGNVLIFDAGTGLRNCSKHLVREWPGGGGGGGDGGGDRPREIHLFASHEHLDHRSGLAFSRFLYARPPFRIHVYGPRNFLRALDESYGVFSRTISPSTHLDDPVDYRMMSATFTGTELTDEDAFRSDDAPPWAMRAMRDPVTIGGTAVRAIEVYHAQTRCLAYRVTHGGASFVFCTDHELRHTDDPADPRQQRSEAVERALRAFAAGADVAYFDGQYKIAEYRGEVGIGPTPPIRRVDWGHSCIEDVIDRARSCQISRTFIGHHDPDREWPERLEIDRQLAELCEDEPFHVELAKSDQVIEL